MEEATLGKAGILVLEHTPGSSLLARFENIHVTYWMAPATGQVARRHEQEALKACHGRKFSHVHVIGRGVGMPTAEGSQVLIAGSKVFAPMLVSIGVVLPSEGLWATLMRAFVVSLRTLLRSVYQIGIFPTTSEVAAWLAPAHCKTTGVTVTERRIAHALELIVNFADHAAVQVASVGAA